MSVSIYYRCKREPLTMQEQEQVTIIIEKYNQDFLWKEQAESFFVYDNLTGDTVFEGATKLPLTEEYELIEATLAYWLACLTDIRHQIAGEWQVHLDDIDAVWRNQQWQMPT